MLNKLFTRIHVEYAKCEKSDDKTLKVLFELFEDELNAININVSKEPYQSGLDAHILNFENLIDYINDIRV